MKTRIVLAALLLALATLQACSNPEQAEASRKAAQAAAEAKDDASCRAGGLQPGTKPYDECRQRIAQARADEAIAQERRREDFQHTLGVGTTDSTGH